MKFGVSFLALVGVFLPSTSAHYTFSQLVVNGAIVGNDWQYIRQHQRSYMPTKGADILSNDFRCNLAAGSGANTQVYAIKAGDKVALKQAYGGTGMAHPGPTQVYMSRAPSGNVKTYAGDGDWFKVKQGLICTPGNAESLRTSAWCNWYKDRIEFTVPSNLPAGQYLIRAEHIAIHGAHEGNAEFYYACAQVSITSGSASSVPGPTVKIPGVYKTSDAAINFSVWGSATSYPYIPGPAVVSGGQTEGSSSGR
ncbi:fungal cellulose binding domain-containing protein [Bisporella sp. PMI_857]|nr:fungal cellulose binding domain-containing protein [Bisporella sp. PMI_857]